MKDKLINIWIRSLTQRLILMNDTSITIVGIDPGASGGIAVFHKGRAMAAKMPKTVREMQDYLNYIEKTYGNVLVFIEKVQAWNTGDDDPGKKFGINKMLANYTKLLTVIQLCNFPYIEVYPISWQSTLKLSFRKQNLSKTERKNRYKKYAGNCFPEIKKMTLAIADALCIVQFALTKLDNDQVWIDENIKNKRTNNLF